MGSWVGDSTVVLAKIAEKHKGHLFCVDWWRGNEGTDLMDIASHVDVFSIFWARICKEGLQDVVIPIRAKSDLAVTIFEKNSFDLIFLDADHRYNAVLADIKRCIPLIRRDNGILCGHDCEGRICDYDEEFMNKGKDVDYWETVHCGVILAVGSIFKDYSINHSIWSVQISRECESFGPTNIKLEGVQDQRQPLPPPLGFSTNYILFRYGRFVYAISKPHCSNIQNIQDFDKLKSFNAGSWQEIQNEIKEPVIIQLESYRGYNVLEYEGFFYALLNSLNVMILSEKNGDIMKEYQADKFLFSAESVCEVKYLVDSYYDRQKGLEDGLPVLIEEGYLGFNVFKFNENYYAIAQDSGKIDLCDPKIRDFLEKIHGTPKCFLGDSVDEVKCLVDKFQNSILETHSSGKDKAIEILKEDVIKYNAAVEELSQKIKSLKNGIIRRDENIVKLYKDVETLNKKTETLQTVLLEKEGSIEEMKKELINYRERYKILAEDMKAQSEYFQNLRKR